MQAAHSLVLEYSGEVANDVDNAEDEAVLGAHGDVRALRVACDGLLCGGFIEQCVHGAEAADLIARGVDGEDEDEDDCEEHCGMRTR